MTTHRVEIQPSQRAKIHRAPRSAQPLLDSGFRLREPKVRLHHRLAVGHQPRAPLQLPRARQLDDERVELNELPKLRASVAAPDHRRRLSGGGTLCQKYLGVEHVGHMYARTAHSHRRTDHNLLSAFLLASWYVRVSRHHERHGRAPPSAGSKPPLRTGRRTRRRWYTCPTSDRPSGPRAPGTRRTCRGTWQT